MSVLLEDPFYPVAAAAGTATACILSVLPLLGQGFQLLWERRNSNSSNNSSSNSSSKTGVAAAAAARGVHTSPKTLALRIILMVPVYAVTSLIAFLYCSPLNSLPSTAGAAGEAEAASAAGALEEVSSAALAPGARHLSPRAAVEAAAAAAAALQQGSGGWIGLWMRGIREGYEVYALYAFLELLIALLGGEQQAVNQLHLKGSLQHLWPLNHILPPMECNRFLVPACAKKAFFSSYSSATYPLLQSLALRWIARLFLIGASGDGAAPAAAAAAAAGRLQDWLICIEMVPCAIAHLWAFPAWEFEAFEKAEGHRTPYSSSNAAAEEWSMLLRQGDPTISAAAASPPAAAAPTGGVYTETAAVEEPMHEGELGSNSPSSSSSRKNKLKKPLKQLVNGVQQLLLSDAVLSDATHAVFGQQQQREFNLETRSPAATIHS
ncbi:hypothetical protein, conserved [Eimeria maxima]|uniref:Uncharacterized protein n=1 Tax=Eimeria maxima TaxID=5804 RepID=U6M2C4_EIMMA|nr:hypothetical protein, conserved [Eimeria maxima]CDJ56564.1 hypothetical protein, conserved [Eimeria maxima]